MPPIFIDLDLTLSYPVYTDATEAKVSKFVFRPSAAEFLKVLSGYGDLILLTASEDGWAEDVLSNRKDLRRFFSRIIQRNDMAEIEHQIVSIFNLAGVSESEKLDLVAMIKPISEPGVIFDDQRYGSDIWMLKSVSVGTYGMGRDFWIQVEKFSRETPDSGGLERALYRFRTRNVRRRNPVELAGTRGYNQATAGF